MTNKRDEPIDEHDLNVERAMRRRSRRSFLAMGIGARGRIAAK
jgi:hypothetical protein